MQTVQDLYSNAAIRVFACYALLKLLAEFAHLVLSLFWSWISVQVPNHFMIDHFHRAGAMPGQDASILAVASTFESVILSGICRRF